MILKVHRSMEDGRFSYQSVSKGYSFESMLVAGERMGFKDIARILGLFFKENPIDMKFIGSSMGEISLGQPLCAVIKVKEKRNNQLVLDVIVTKYSDLEVMVLKGESVCTF